MGNNDIGGDTALFTLENAPIGLAHVSEWGAFQYVNNEYAKIAGWPKEELLKMGWPDITHPEDVMPDSRHVEALLRREMPSYQMDKRYITKDNRTVWVSLNVWAYFKDGKFVNFIVAIEDITERQYRMMRLEQKLDNAISDLNALNNRLNRSGTENDRGTIRAFRGEVGKPNLGDQYAYNQCAIINA